MKKIILLLVLLMLPLVLGAAMPISPECKSVTSLDYNKQVRCELDTTILMENKLMIDQTDNLIGDVLTATTEYEIDSLLAADFYSFFKYLFWALYTGVLVYTGYLYMSSAAFPEKRSKAGKQLKNILIIGVLIVALPLIILTTNDLANDVSLDIKDKAISDEDYFTFNSLTPQASSGFDGDIERNSLLESRSSFFIFSAKSYLVSMNLRHILLLFLISISPLILLLFYALPTQEYGKFFVYVFFIEQFIPVANMIIFKFSQILAPGESGNIELETAKLKLLSSALILCVLLHIVLIGLSLLKAVINIKVLAQIRSAEVES
ncbi:MAG: hypothetical protein ABIA37_05255 [Candidatus Woesearchaeota archaeon]